jgi:hypothetical protein
MRLTSNKTHDSQQMTHNRGKVTILQSKRAGTYLSPALSKPNHTVPTFCAVAVGSVINRIIKVNETVRLKGQVKLKERDREEG